MRKRSKKHSTLRPNVDPNFETLVGFCFFVFSGVGRSFNSALWLIFLSAFIKRSRKCEIIIMQLLAGQCCKKDYPSYHLQIWSFYTRKHNLPTQWFPRQFSIDIHLFHLIPEKFKSQIGIFFLPREKLSSLTLYDALVVLSLELEHSYTEHWRSAVCAAYGDTSNWNVNVLFFKRTVSTSVARAREAIITQN